MVIQFVIPAEHEIRACLPDMRQKQLYIVCGIQIIRIDQANVATPCVLESDVPGGAVANIFFAPDQPHRNIEVLLRKSRNQFR